MITQHPGQLFWTKAVQGATSTRSKHTGFRPGIRAVFSSSWFSVPRIQTAVSAPSVHHLLTVTIGGSGAAEFVGCDPENADDFEKHAETRARQNTIVASFAFHNQLCPTFIHVLLGSFHVRVAAFDGDDALIPVGASDTRNNPSASVAMLKHLSNNVHFAAFNVVFTAPVQRGVITGTFFIPFTVSVEFLFGGAPAASVRPVTTINPALPCSRIPMDLMSISPNGKWFLDLENRCTWCLRFQCAQGHPGVTFEHDGANWPLFTSDSSQIWNFQQTKLEILSLPDGKPVLVVPSGELPPGYHFFYTTTTTVGLLAPVFPMHPHQQTFMVMEATKDTDGQIKLHSETIDIDGDDVVNIRKSCPAQERWQPRVLFLQSVSKPSSRLGCVNVSPSEPCGFQVAFGPTHPETSYVLSVENLLVHKTEGCRMLPFATLFDVSIPVHDRALCAIPLDTGWLRGSVRFDE